MNEQFLMTDSFINRVFTLPSNGKATGRVIIARIISTLPIMIGKDDFIPENTIKEAKDTVQQGDGNKLVDEEWFKANKNKDRMVFMGAAKSPFTSSRAYFYYDNKYQDIIILPNIDMIALAGNNIVFPIDGFRLGSGVGMRTTSIVNTISMDEADRVKLPEGKGNISTINTRFVSLPLGGNNKSVDSAKITTYIQDQYSFEESDSSLFTLVELGTKADVFNNPTNLPVYLFYQTSLVEYGIRYLGFKDTGTNKLYVKLAF